MTEEWNGQQGLTYDSSWGDWGCYPIGCHTCFKPDRTMVPIPSKAKYKGLKTKWKG